MCRGAIESGAGQAEAEALQIRILEWLTKLNLWQAVEPDEEKVLRTSLGSHAIISYMLQSEGKKMVQAQIFQGTWEEIMHQARALQGRKDLTLIVPETQTAEEQTSLLHFYLTATPEEFERAFDALGQGNENQALPPEAFERESLYDENRF